MSSTPATTTSPASTTPRPPATTPRPPTTIPPADRKALTFYFVARRHRRRGFFVAHRRGFRYHFATAILGWEMVNSGDVLGAIQSGDLDLLRQLISRDHAAAASRDTSGVSALMNALYRGRQDMVEVLLASGLSLDIFEAAALGNSSRTRELLAGNADLANAVSADGFTPLHFACFFRQEGSARQLLQSGARPAAVADNNMKVQPLHSAAAARQRGIAEMLLQAGAPVNARQQGGWTALHAAAQHGDRETAELLLEYGADPLLANDEGKTPGDLAAQHPELLRVLNNASARRETAS